MDDPERALPRYCWRKPALHNDGTGRWQLSIPLAYIGEAAKHGDRKKKNRRHNPWPYPISLFEPICSFWASIEWYESEQTSVQGDDINITSYADFTVAFQLITSVNLCYGMRDEPEKTTRMERLHIFNYVTKRIEHILKRRMHP